MGTPLVDVISEIVKAGTSEGAKKGWRTRKHGRAPEARESVLGYVHEKLKDGKIASGVAAMRARFEAGNSGVSGAASSYAAKNYAQRTRRINVEQAEGVLNAIKSGDHEKIISSWKAANPHVRNNMLGGIKNYLDAISGGESPDDVLHSALVDMAGTVTMQPSQGTADEKREMTAVDMKHLRNESAVLFNKHFGMSEADSEAAADDLADMVEGVTYYDKDVIASDGFEDQFSDGTFLANMKTIAAKYKK